MSTNLESLKNLFSAELGVDTGAVFTNGDDNSVEKDLTSSRITNAAFNSVFSDILSISSPQERVAKLLSEGR